LRYNDFDQKTFRKEPILMKDIIPLLQKLTTGLLEAQDTFNTHMDQFPEFEQAVVGLTNQMAAEFLGVCLTAADDLIREHGRSRSEYKVQRKRQRTLISSVGDITFTHTLYKDTEGHTRCLLDELIRLPDKERFTTMAEAKILHEAQVHSYQHAAESIKSGSQTITKATVMNKVHAVEEDLAGIDPKPEEKKQVRYLYIEADEDHIHSQKDDEAEHGYIGKLVYLFEGKEEVCKDRMKLVAPHYFGGLYSGAGRNAELWEEVESYIRDHYDQDYLKCVYVSGDGGGWIKSATSHISHSKFVADRFHLMKYIYSVARCTLDDREATIGRFYKYIYNNKPVAARKLLTRIQNHCDKSDRAVEECRTFLMNNWDAIQVAFHDKHVLGCSAEGHVSCIYSERLSSRPMGWSETGSDRMCRLRCFVNNYGSGKIIDLVKYRREREIFKLAATGTDGQIAESVRKHYTPEQRNARSYIDCIQASLPMNSTARKAISIKEQISMI